MQIKLRCVVILTSIIISQITNANDSGVVYSFEKVGASYAHIITFDYDEYDLTPIAANSIRGNRKETVKSIAKHTGAIAAINGGFFHLNSSAAGILKISGQWLGIAYRPRSALAWDNKGNILFGFPNTHSFIKTKSETLKINSMNNTKAKNRPILFSEPLHRQDIISTHQACFISFKDSKIIAYSYNALDIPKNGYVYYSPEKNLCKKESIDSMDYFKLNISIIESEPQNKWNSMPFIIGGAPMLIYDGKIANFNLPGNKVRKDFFEGKHGRTAIGKLNNGWIMLIIIEEDPFEKNSGFSINELAKYMLDKGCIYAINLDGGSSTSMFIDKKIVKHSVSKGYANFNLVSNALILSKKGE